MRMQHVNTAVAVFAFLVAGGCDKSAKNGNLVAPGPDPGPPLVELNKQAPADEPPPTIPPTRSAFTAENNPTTLAGRGAPDLKDHTRPAAWLYIDGVPGEYREEDGHKLLQWFATETVSATPTIRLEVYEPLVGRPAEVAFSLEPVTNEDGTKVAYELLANPGTFVLGREYSLNAPGEDFTVRARRQIDTITEIPPLSPGTYLLAASIKMQSDPNMGALAVTFFTVAAK